MPEVENCYNRIETVLPDKALLVIDSLEGVTHKYGLEMEEFVMALQKDLVENSNTNVVMILEKPEAGGIEYLVDGLVSVVREELDERRVRHMRLEKLRATAIGQPRYAVTLAGGRFTALGPGSPLTHSTTPPPQWAPEADPERFYSTASATSTRLLGGGFRRGSYNAFEVDVNVGIDDYYLVLVPTFLNFLTQSRGITAVLAAGESPEKLRDTITRYCPPHIFDSRVRIADYTASESEEAYIVPMARYRPGRSDPRDDERRKGGPRPRGQAVHRVHRVRHDGEPHGRPGRHPALLPGRPADQAPRESGHRSPEAGSPGVERDPEHDGLVLPDHQHRQRAVHLWYPAPDDDLLESRTTPRRGPRTRKLTPIL